MSAVSGYVKNMELWISGTDGSLLQIRGITMNILPSKYEEAIESSDELTAFQEAMEAVSDIETIRSLAYGAIPSAEKGAALGVATLDASGNLKQMPNAKEVGAIPATEKGTSGGVATLNTEGRVVQVPAMLCNPNLLDNWYLTLPINQRGKTSYTENGYTIDRWYISNGEMELEADGLRLMLNNGGSLVEYLDGDFTQYYGNDITVSILAGNKIYSATGVLPQEPPLDYETYAKVNLTDTLYLRFLYSPVKKGYQVNLSSNADGNTVKITAIKLEMGKTSTLALGKNGIYTLREVPNYQQELAKCQRYFYRLGAAEGAAMVGQGSAGGGTTAIYFSLYMPVTMRIRPTLSLSKNGCMTITKTTFSAGNASTGIQLTASDKLNQLLTLIVQADGLDATGIFRAWLNPGEYLDFSADL